jgi:hypothetical protein
VGLLHHRRPADGVEELVATLSSHESLYGGVLAARLDGPDLVLTFDEEAAHLFGWPRELSLHLEVAGEEREALRTGLAEVLAVGPNGATPIVAL